MDTVFDFNMVFPKIEVIEEDKKNNRKKFQIEPLERGFGNTVGNALRRVALSSLPGGAVKKIEIKGVSNEFDVLETIVEDITTVVLAVKNISLKIDTQDEDFVLVLKGNKKGVLTAGDITAPAGVEIANKDLKICTLSEDKDFEMTLVASKGLGYVLADENRGTDKQAGAIYVDSIYTPVTKFSYSVEDTRVGDRTDFDKLVVDITTNGSLTPEEALSYSGRIMQQHMNLIVELEKNIELSKVFVDVNTQTTNVVEENKVSETSIETLDISNRAYNGLKRANINTIEELSSKSKKDISGLDNIGSKTIDEIEKQLEELGFSFK